MSGETKSAVTVRLSNEAIQSIDDLIGSVYGTNRGEVARSLIVDHLKKLAADGLIELHFSRSD